MRISDWSSDVCSSDLEDGDRRIRVARTLSAAPVHFSAPPAAAAAAPAAPAAVAVESAADHPGAVKSPLVGTVYLSAEPGAAPFIAEGTQVQASDTLLIVEAMKVMNPITAPRAGRVAQQIGRDHV